MTSTVHRLRDWLVGLPRNLTAVLMLALVLVSFLQSPGRMTFDTKLDLPIDPAGFLARSLHLWNPEATAGELQNQAYGYLFPIGPFFTAGQWLGLPGWITQRLWCALLLCVAFAGMLALTRAMRIGRPAARYLGAFAYALSPRMLTEIGPLSAEMLAAVMLPWILLPLVRADKIGSPRRAAGLSALALLCVGGINAAVVVTALVLPGLWLLTRRWTKAHVKLVLWWAASVLAVCLWWILPLLLFGRYSLPFLDYIESAANTTGPVSLFQALRGTSQWVAYLVQGEPWWPSGYLLVDNPVLMIATGLVAAIAILGLVSAKLPERRFLVLGVVTGLALLTIGYLGNLDGPFAGALRALLDGPLAPLRNVHKFEPGLRLPLLLAFTHAISGPRRDLSPVWTRRVRLAVGVVLVIAVSAPAWLFTLRPGPAWEQLPDHWRSAMSWLHQQDERSRTLLVPATSFGRYEWGRTIDEPAQALAQAPWAVRGQIPLGSEGNTRVMDTVEGAIGNGRGSPGLAGFLARSGHRFVLLRNDIIRTEPGTPAITVLRAGLAASPGITRVATFGPSVRPGDLPGALPIDRTAESVPTLEIYQVSGQVRQVDAVAVSDVATVSGGPEALLPLIGSGLLDQDTPTVLAGDTGAGEAHGPVLVTDGLRKRERNVGRVRDNLSQTMTATETGRFDRPALDLLPVHGEEHQTVAAYRGVRAVSASTSAAYADATTRSDPARQPFAAIDGDPTTAWHSSAFTGPAGQWLEVELDTPRVVDEISLTLVDDLTVGWPVDRIRIDTDTGSVEQDVTRGGEAKGFRTSGGVTNRVRVTVLSVAADRTEGNTGIAELTIPGVSATRALRVPTDRPRDGGLEAFAFSRGAEPRFACVPSDPLGCDAALATGGEEPGGIHRLLRTSADSTYLIEGTVLPAPGAALPVAVPGVAVTATSHLGGDPTVAPLAAVDGDPTTTWIPGGGDQKPTITLTWPTPRSITGLTLRTDERSGAARPSEVEVKTIYGPLAVKVDDFGNAGVLTTTDKLEISVSSTDPLRPVGVSDLIVSGADTAIPPVPAGTPIAVPCGAGPTITVDATVVKTTVTGTLGDVQAHRPLSLRTCGDPVELKAGPHEVRTGRGPFVVQDLAMRPVDRSESPARHRGVRIDRWDAGDRSIVFDAGPTSILRVAENANPGWSATVDGVALTPVRVDGWQQGWLLPEGGAGVVTLEFTPDGDYRLGLLIGALAVLAVIGLTALPVRRRTEVDVGPARSRLPLVLLVVLVVPLGGMFAVVALIGALVLGFLRPWALPSLAVGGAVVATTVSVIGRLAGEGQQWAHSTLTQGAVLLAVAAVVAYCLDWPARDET